MALAAAAQGLRIHFPIFVGVLFMEMLCLLMAGAFSPAVLRMLATIRPFQWTIPLALNMPAMRRRFFADHVALVRRKIEAQRRRANDERYVSLPVELYPGTPLPPRSAQEPPESFLCSVFSHPDWRERSHVLIESPGGRGKSALLREVVLRMLERFAQSPSLPLPLLCDAPAHTLEEAARGALEALPLDAELQQVLLRRGDYVLVLDGFSESSLSLESLRVFLDGRYGPSVRLLISSRPHPGLRHAVEGADRWLRAEPRRLDEQSLARFAATYAPDGSSALDETTRRVCRGPDGTYLPILVRLAFLQGAAAGRSIAELYAAAFHNLLRRGEGEGEGEDSTLLARTSELCVRTYWATGIRSLRYRNAPEQELMQKLLRAGVLVPEGPGFQPEPAQVRFFHDSMQSYLTAVGLFAHADEQPGWELLFRAAADPLFTRSKSELGAEAGSELFQMCLQVFGPDERLRAELVRQLEEWAALHANDFSRGHIAEAVPEPLRELFREHLQRHSELSAEHALRLAIELCQEEPRHLGILYARVASLRWALGHRRGGQAEQAPAAPSEPQGGEHPPLH